MTATGTLARYVPPGSEQDNLLRLVRLGECFARQQVGRRPGALSQHIAEVVERAKPKNLRELEVELAFAASFRRDAGPIIEVDRSEGVVTYRDGSGRERDVRRKTLANLFSIARKKAEG